MKKILASVLSTAMLASLMTFNVYAEDISSSVYTIDSAEKTISGIAPLTTVESFKNNISGDIMVVNIDGSEMTTGYATDNVFARTTDGSIYKLVEKYSYAPIKTSGEKLDDGTDLYNNAATDSTISLNSASGFTRVEKAAKIGYGSDNAAPSIGNDQTIKATKNTENGESIYVLDNDSNRYALLRSHYTASANYSTTLQSSTGTSALSNKPIVTTMTFEADKLGNISLYHNVPVRDANGKMTKGDSGMTGLLYSAEYPYIANAVHFLEDGSIMVGGTNENYTSSQRTPKNKANMTWQPGKKYTVSVIQRFKWGGREGYVDGIYVNGVKVFPNSETLSHSDGRVALQADGSYKIGTKSNDVRYGGGISSIMIGTAPKTEGENLSVKVSNVKVYTPAQYNNAVDSDITLTASNINVDNDKNEITVLGNMDAEEFLADISTDAKSMLYNADGEQASGTVRTGMYLKVVSADGLATKTYSVDVTSSDPETNVYSVDTDAHTISGVAPFTTVEEFLGAFSNGGDMSVVNVDGSIVNGYATENVFLRSIDGTLYNIIEKLAYAPIRDNGSQMADGAEIYNDEASNISATGSGITDSGFNKIEQYDKIGFGSDNKAPANTDDMTVKAVKDSENGKDVYVIENDSENYTYLRSHYTASANYSTTLQSSTGTSALSNKPIVTTMTFEADKLGNVSLFHNVPVRDANGKMTKGDSGMDGVVYGVENPYLANSVNFMEDGSIMLGGAYANYSTSQRTPIQTIGMTWQPGKKYTVSVIQRFKWGGREGYVDAVYINGVKVFPNSETLSHSDGRVALQADGSYKIGTKSNDVRYGGGISSIMIGTAPKNAGENMKVTLSDVKVYSTTAYDANADKDITISSLGSAVVDNDLAIIKCTKSTEAESLLGSLYSDAKLAVYNADGTIAEGAINNGAYVKAVSDDGLSAKTYSIVTEGIIRGFYAEENGTEITSMKDVNDNIWFEAEIADKSILDGTDPTVILAVFDKNNVFVGASIATGVKEDGTRTVYKANIDISEMQKDGLYAVGYVWSNLDTMVSLADAMSLR